MFYIHFVLKLFKYLCELHKYLSLSADKVFPSINCLFFFFLSVSLVLAHYVVESISMLRQYKSIPELLLFVHNVSM